MIGQIPGKRSFLSNLRQIIEFLITSTHYRSYEKIGMLLADFQLLTMTPSTHKATAFSLVEVVVAVSVVSIAAACAVGALTRFNALASTARNATGAYTAVMNQIDLTQSDSPFNPQKTNPDGTAQIPPELQIGTRTQNNIPVYQDPKTGVIVTGTMTTTVTDVSSTYSNGSVTFPLTMYKAVVTINYTYLNRNYSFSMSTTRTSDI